MQAANTPIQLSLLHDKKISLAIKREDLLHPQISGNKYRKLKYNLIEAKKKGFKTLLTFGGAYSNHIVATAYAGKKEGFHTIGVIRGEELVHSWQQNPTLQLAVEHGMRLHFITRGQYQRKEEESVLNTLRETYGAFYLLPEGGSNVLAVKGCEEILNASDVDFDIICTAVGTGGTLAGLANAAHNNQLVMGFPALKGDFLNDSIRKFVARSNWELVTDYHFGGYAKVTKELVVFINQFRKQTGIPLDPVYTGKMIFGILEMVKGGQFKPHTRILAIHTGGLQGIFGMNTVLKNRNLPLIDL